MNKKEQIFRAALKLFNQNGFDKTPTSLVAKEADVAVGTLFHYYSTKEDLINSLYLRCKESMIGNMLSQVEKEITYKGKMKQIYVNFLKWGMENTEEFRFFQQFSNSTYINDMTRTEGKNMFAELIGFLREGIDREILRKIQEDYLLAITTAFLMSTLNYIIQNPQLIGQEDFVEESFNYLWNSVKN